MDDITFEAIFAPISGAIKSTADGGARITLEVDETVALMIHTFKVASGEQTMQITMSECKVKVTGRGE